MTSRQKAIMGGVIIVVLVIIWQVMGLFGDKTATISSPAPSTSNPKMTANAPLSSSPTPNTNAASPSSPLPQAVQGTAELKQASVLNDTQFMKSQRTTEEKYISKLNELEDLKIQRAIAETNQSIAAAKLATVTAERDISNLLTGPLVTAAPPVPESAYANRLVNPTQMGQQVIATTPTTTQVVVSTPPIIEYTVISVSMLQNKWNAVIGYQGKLYDVGIGDILPPDGSTIVRISKNSVTLKKDGKIRKVGLTTSI